MKIQHITLAILALAFAALGACFLNGCATGADGKQHFSQAQFEKDWNDPRTQAVVRGVETTALNIGLSALTQYAAGQPIDLKADALSGGIAALRTTIGTNMPLAAVHQTVADGISEPQLKKPVADAVTAAVSAALAQNLSPDAAKEAVAQGLDLSVAAAPFAGDALP